MTYGTLTQIFNRWGQKMWESHDHMGRWDGRNKGGDRAAEGVYYYTLETRFKNDSRTKNGFIHLINGR